MDGIHGETTGFSGGFGENDFVHKAWVEVEKRHLSAGKYRRSQSRDYSATAEGAPVIDSPVGGAREMAGNGTAN